MNCFRYCLFFVACLSIGIAGQAPVAAQLTIVGYDSTNPNGASGDPSPNLAAAENVADVSPLFLSRGAGLIPNQGITFNSRDWSTASTVDIGSDDYIQWGWSASTGAYDLENMTIQYDRSGSGPTQLEIWVSINGDAMQSVFVDDDIFIGDETHTIDLTFLDDVSSAQFRLYAFDATSLGGTFDIERFNSDPDPSRAIVVRGFAVAVPEPTGGLLIIGLSFGFFVQRRRIAVE